MWGVLFFEAGGGALGRAPGGAAFLCLSLFALALGPSWEATVVLSDLAPKMIGSAIDDHMASVELSKKALRWALQGARPEQERQDPRPPLSVFTASASASQEVFAGRRLPRSSARGCSSAPLCLASPMSPTSPRF